MNDECIPELISTLGCTVRGVHCVSTYMPRGCIGGSADVAE